MLQPGAIVMVLSSDYGWDGRWGKVVAHDDCDYWVEMAGEEKRQVKFKRRELREFVLYEKGTIVTICCAKSAFDGMQGQIIRWDDENKLYIIKVHTRYSNLVLAETDGYVRFEFTELDRDENWHPDNEACRLFGSLYNSLLLLKYKFVPGGECRHEGCTQKVSRRILVNECCGTVTEVDVCEQHALKCHGGFFEDGFPYKSEQVKAG